MTNDRFRIWVCEGLSKVFPDMEAPSDPIREITFAGAAGENEVAQIAIRAMGEDLPLSLPQVSDLRSSDGQIVSGKLTSYFVDLVPVTHNTQGVPRTHLTRTAPCFFPDPLALETRTVVSTEQTRSIWVRIEIPRTTPAGDYAGKLIFTLAGSTVRIPIKLTVWPIVLPKQAPCSMTLWVWPGLLAKHHCVKLYSEAFWTLIERYAKEMAAHHQDTIFTTILGADSLIKIQFDPDGQYLFDFSLFDRWVGTFLDAGFRFIEGSHFCDRGYRYTEYFDQEQQTYIKADVAGSVDKFWEVEPYSEIVTALLPALRDHLRARGWDKIYRQHIYDEPSIAQVPDYLKLVKHLRSFWSDVTIIEAADSAAELFEAIDIIVPQADHYHLHRRTPAPSSGPREDWIYTCNHPRGKFPNVFLDQPLIMTRVLFWLMWKYDIQGFLYYALGYWEVQHAVKRTGFDPYTGEQNDPIVLYDPWNDSCQNATWQVPPGSWGFVYPPREPCSLDPRLLCPRLVENFNRVRQGLTSNKADEGPMQEFTTPIDGVVGSIRWEQLREGVEDYSLLCVARDEIKTLKQSSHHNAAADDATRRLHEIIGTVVEDWNTYTLDSAAIQAARKSVAELIIECRQGQV